MNQLSKLKCKVRQRDQYDDIFDMMHMTKIDREIVRRAFQSELADARNRYVATMLTYIFLNNIITIGSVLVVSFMSIEKITLVSGSVSEAFFWASWIISIVVVVASKLVGSFSLQKRFVMDKIVLEKYRNEGWKFASRIGPYEGKPVSDSFKYFINKIQRIKMRFVENATQSNNGSNSMFNSGLDLNSSNFVMGGTPTRDRNVTQCDVDSGEKMYTESSGMSPEIFNKFEFGDIEIQSMASSVHGDTNNDNIDVKNLDDITDNIINQLIVGANNTAEAPNSGQNDAADNVDDDWGHIDNV